MDGIYGDLTCMQNKDMIMQVQDATRNYFIMDSEQLVVNPFEDLQKEALDKEKKSSLTERLTAVKNNVCENHLSIKSEVLNRDITTKMRKLHENSSALRYEYKLFDIYRRQNELETKKRVEPGRDFTYDSKQIKISEKRLGIMTESFYLNKRNPYPLRGRNINDFDSGPTITRARLKLKTQEDFYREEEKNRARLSTPGSMSYASTSTRAPLWQRRGSKSAPPSTMVSSAVKRKNPYEDSEMDSKLPLIAQQKHNKDTHVKFSLNDERYIPTPSPEPMIVPVVRPHTYTNVRGRRNSAWTSLGGSDSEDDEIDFTQKINLRAVLFRDRQVEAARPHTRESSRSVPAMLRRSSTNKPLTQEMLIEEQEKIGERMTQFLSTIKNSGDYEEEPPPPPPPPPQETKAAPKFPKVATTTSRAGALLSVFSKPIDSSLKWKTAEELKREEEEAAGRFLTSTPETQRSHSSASQRPVKAEKDKKNKWDYIRASIQDGSIHRCTTPTQLILQQMTRLNLNNVKQSRIPLASAGRAMRHTPTFKMRKVVEKLMASRTKFEQQEVDKLRSQLDGGSDNGKQVEASA